MIKEYLPVVKADGSQSLGLAGLLVHLTQDAVTRAAATGACPIESTPASYAPANIMGLKMLMRLGLHLTESSFAFDFKFEFLE
ncbi:hypothetical protein WJX72_007322 [[Myrmecia] bisecta]|uniref:Uncharacterized protein n=1 Tax=[Myrmecia] bisecta TaxID=41462 RepID=A0AAW1QFZ0_9CHLO